MAKGYNRITIVGNLGADPEMRHTPSGKAVCNLRVAVGRGGGQDRQEETDWFTVVVWEKQAETANEHLHSGSKILVEGRMQMRTYEKDGEKRTAWDLQASYWQFMDSKKSDDDEAPRKSSSRRRDEDDDVPVRPVRKAVRRDEDDDDDEPAPPKKRARRDEDEDEDEEPAPPKKSSRYR